MGNWRDYGYNPHFTAHFTTRDGKVFHTRALSSYSSSRSMGQPGSQATLSFPGLRWLDTQGRSGAAVLHKDIDQTLSLYDICQVKAFDREGRTWIDVNGLITGITQTEVESDGKPTPTTTITLVGLGHFLSTTSLFFHPHIAGRANISGVGYLNRAGGNPPKGRPDQVLRQIFRVFINEDYNVRLADGRQLSEAIGLAFTPIRDGMALLALQALGMEENLWNVMKRFADQPFNNLWVDIPQKTLRDLASSSTDIARVTDFAVAVYLEPTPFGFKDWDKLAQKGSDRFFRLRDDERLPGGFVRQRTSEGISSMFWCGGKAVTSALDQMSALYEKGGLMPLYLDKLIQQFGLRRLEQTTEYVQYFKPDHEANGLVTPQERQQMQTTYPDRHALLLKRSTQLAQWFGYKEGFYRGEYTTRGRIGWSVNDGARLASVVRDDQGREFWVTGLAQNWSHPGPFTTTWTLERGHYPLAYRKAWAEFAADLAKKSDKYRAVLEDNIANSPLGTGQLF